MDRSGRTSVSLATYALLQKRRQATGLGALEEILGLWVQDCFKIAVKNKQESKKTYLTMLNPFTAKDASLKKYGAVYNQEHFSLYEQEKLVAVLLNCPGSPSH